MSEPFVGEIRMFGGNFAPRGFALCDGQLLAVAQNDALFALIGTTYGGDGRTTFALPDLRGRIPIHQSLSHRIGSRAGNETVTLVASQMPSHKHTPRVGNGPGGSADPVGNVPARAPVNAYNNAAPDTPLASNITNTGGNQAHNNMMPSQCVNFVIALLGIFPSRN